MNEFELLMTEAYDEGVVTEVIRPSAVVPENSARRILVEMALRDVDAQGVWRASPTEWKRFDRPWPRPGDQGAAELLGVMQVAYGTPTRYEITIYRATITAVGSAQGWTVGSLCDEALGMGGLTLDSCPRADLQPPPKPFRLR